MYEVNEDDLASAIASLRVASSEPFSQGEANALIGFIDNVTEFKDKLLEWLDVEDYDVEPVRGAKTKTPAFGEYGIFIAIPDNGDSDIVLMPSV